MTEIYYTHFLLTLILLLLFSGDAASTPPCGISLTIPCKPPKNASDIIDRSFLGFAFEQASFYNYSFGTDGKPNTFSQNLIYSVVKRTGGTPILRVGGTSGDKGHYDASLVYPVDRPATEGGPVWSPPYLRVGPSYFEAFKNFPGAIYVFMVPLSHRNLNNSLEWARQGLAAIGDRLHALDIGNEPEQYRWFDLATYVKEFVRFQKALASEFPQQLGCRPISQALDTGWGSADRVPTSAALEAGINSTGGVRQVAYHLYQVSDVPGAGLEHLQRRVANHTAIVANMASFEPHIKHLQDNAPGVPFVLSENGNSLGRPNLEQRNVFATALWNVDYQLHAMAMGVTRVNNQQIVCPGYQMWLPVDSPKFGPRCVRPNFYSQPFLAEFIGRSGKTRVFEFDIPGTDLFSAYVAFDDEVPTRIALVNLQLWTPTNGTRPSTEVTLNGIGGSTRMARLHKLASPDGALATQFITWRGLQWTSESNGLEVFVGNDGESWPIQNGTLALDLEATSAVIVDLDNEWDTTIHQEVIAS